MVYVMRHAAAIFLADTQTLCISETHSFRCRNTICPQMCVLLLCGCRKWEYSVRDGYFLCDYFVHLLASYKEKV